jgi:hypothetical protein
MLTALRRYNSGCYVTLNYLAQEMTYPIYICIKINCVNLLKNCKIAWYRFTAINTGKKSGHILISALFVTEKNKSASKMVFVVCESRLRALDKGSCCKFKEFQDTW